MNNLAYVLLFAPPKEGESPLMSLLPLILILAVFYFFMIRPQMKKQKEIRNFREKLTVGDKVITTGGIYGKIAEIKDNYIMLEVDDKVKLKVDKVAIIRDPSDLDKK